jgi:hypothetical protein
MTETNLPEDGIQPCAEESENPLPSHVVVLEGTGLIISVSSADLAIAEERGRTRILFTVQMYIIFHLFDYPKLALRKTLIFHKKGYLRSYRKKIPKLRLPTLAIL